MTSTIRLAQFSRAILAASVAVLASLTTICHGQAVKASTPAGNDSIRPFQFHASEEALKDLRQRLAATQWPEKETVGDATQGVQLDTMTKLASYWLGTLPRGSSRNF